MVTKQRSLMQFVLGMMKAGDRPVFQPQPGEGQARKAAKAAATPYRADIDG